MPLSRVEQDGVVAVEGTPGEPLVARPDDAARVAEACLSERAGFALLYPANLPGRFFDLSSGEAGAILDKLRRYRIQLAIVCPPGSVRFSHRFRELIADDYAVFETRDAARAWIRLRARRGSDREH